MALRLYENWRWDVLPHSEQRPWIIFANNSCEFTKNYNITTMKPNTDLYVYSMGYSLWDILYRIFSMGYSLWDILYGISPIWYFWGYSTAYSLWDMSHGYILWDSRWNILWDSLYGIFYGLFIGVYSMLIVETWYILIIWGSLPISNRLQGPFSSRVYLRLREG